MKKTLFAGFGLVLSLVWSLRAVDWPTWRGDAVRSGVVETPLPQELHLVWTRKLGIPLPAWPESQHKIQFDVSYEPVVSGKKLFIGSMVADHVTAYDTDTGNELWRFYTSAPVRFAPHVWKELVIFGSDDGFIYALNVSDGSVAWSKSGAPREQWILGNFRLGSTWPVRGAPVVIEETDGGHILYVAAGMWPFMGTFIYALDPSSGEEIWRNSGSGAVFVLQQHHLPAFAGVAPQGYMTAGDDVLLVSGGRTVPAGYDRHTGEFKYFEVASREFDRSAGGYEVGVLGDRFFNGGCIYEISDATPLANLRDGRQLPAGRVDRVGDGFVSIGAADRNITWYDNKIESFIAEEVTRWGKTNQNVRFRIAEGTRLARRLPARQTHFQAGSVLYLSGPDGWIGALDRNGVADSNLVWETRVGGDVWTMVPGDGKLFAVTREGELFAFGGGEQPGSPVTHPEQKRATSDKESLAGPEGYAMLWGLTGIAEDYLVELAGRFHVIGIDQDRGQVEELRRKMDDSGWYGRRMHFLSGSPLEMSLPNYLASRLEVRLPYEQAALAAQQAWKVLRPYDGTAFFHEADSGSGGSWLARFNEKIKQRRQKSEALTSFAGELDKLRQEGARGYICNKTGEACLGRTGALPGSAYWTHENADPGNSVVSRDLLVKPPLGLLWFGGMPNDDILPRHGHGPAPQVVGGRVFIEGPDALRSVDVYTGRLLWQRIFPGLGLFYDNTSHQPGANEIGSNYVSVEDGVYVVYSRQCLRLDPVTGDTIATFTLPAGNGEEAPHWGYVGVYEDLLIGGSEPFAVIAGEEKEDVKVERNVPYAASSTSIVVMDRYSGEVLWQRKAGQVFRHNAIAVAAGKLFCIDGLSQMNLDMLRRRGDAPEEPALLMALDVRTGETIWTADEKIRGTWLGYSSDYDILIEGGSPGGDRAADEAVGHTAAYRAKDGELLWRTERKYRGRPILHKDRIYTDRGGFCLLTGQGIEKKNPFTGKGMNWNFTRSGGCNSPVGSEYMLLFRSGAAGYYDLSTDGGTGNWGGFRSGCTVNLIAADGVLSAPDYTRTCTCSYQNQCSLAMISMPDVENWTYQPYNRMKEPLKRMAINFGAPGDWPAPDGTLWLEYPMVGGNGPDLGLEIEGEANWFRRHSIELAGAYSQVAASGVSGDVKIAIPLKHNEQRSFNVRLVFSDIENELAGERIFDVYLQGERVLQGLDIAAEAGGKLRSHVCSFENIAASDKLLLELRSSEGSRLSPILSGISFYCADDI